MHYYVAPACVPAPDQNFQIVCERRPTYSMGLSVRWKDSRMRLYRNWLSLNGDKRIWSPEIVIWSPMVSQVNNGEVYVTQDSGGILASKDLSLNTQVKCEMDYQTFPFDKHICYLEVNLKSFTSLIVDQPPSEKN